MADLLSSVSPIALPATLSPPGALPAAPNLAAFVELMAGQAGATPTAVPGPTTGTGKRQDDAAPGNILPDGGATDATDPALAWLLAGQIPVVAPQAVPGVTTAGASIASSPIASNDGQAAPLPTAARLSDAISHLPDADIRRAGAAIASALVLPTEIEGQGAPIIAPLPAREGLGVGQPVVGDTRAASAPSRAAMVRREAGGSLSTTRPTPNPSLPGRGIAFVPAAMREVDDPAVASTTNASLPRIAVTLPDGAVAIDRVSVNAVGARDTRGAAVSAPAPSAVDSVPPSPAVPSVAPQDAGSQPAAQAQFRAPHPAAAAQPVSVRHPSIAPHATAAPTVLPALFALAAAAERPSERDDRATAPLSLDPAAAAAATPAAVAPTTDPQRQSLDMGRHDWPEKMIEHIETLRDDANARDTSIRLKPEALGRVDVALRTHDDGAVSVRFTAEQPATRTLIADAAPQLREAAEARGIRLTQTSVDLSRSGQEQRARPDAAPRLPISNHIAGTTGDDTDAVDDGRIA